MLGQARDMDGTVSSILQRMGIGQQPGVQQGGARERDRQALAALGRFLLQRIDRAYDRQMTPLDPARRASRSGRAARRARAGRRAAPAARGPAHRRAARSPPLPLAASRERRSGNVDCPGGRHDLGDDDERAAAPPARGSRHGISSASADVIGIVDDRAPALRREDPREQAAPRFARAGQQRRLDRPRPPMIEQVRRAGVGRGHDEGESDARDQPASRAAAPSGSSGRARRPRAGWAGSNCGARRMRSVWPSPST